MLGAAFAVLALVGPTASAHAAESRTHRPGSFAPHLGRSIVPTGGDYMGAQLATWYGPGFWGNRTACGKTLQPSSWGIAHRTLPCGSLVSLNHKGRRVTVRVIDRGPYSGATVDLTARTKQFLRFTSGSVKMAKVERFRLMPRRTARAAS